MRRLRRALLAALVLIGSTGCLGYALVKAEPRSIKGCCRVDPQIEWNRRSARKLEVWTLHGEALEALQFVGPIADQEPLLAPPPGGKEKHPLFRSGMSESEVMELVVDSLGRLGAARVEGSDLRPHPLGSRAGLRFELSWMTPEGLEMQGLAAASVAEDRLLLILFRAPRAHYFPTYAPVVERVLQSVQLQ